MSQLIEDKLDNYYQIIMKNYYLKGSVQQSDQLHRTVVQSHGGKSIFCSPI